ncbi:hypothetical protein LIER_30912 [Lithospermum erythrorhizon]|uniref:SWIM-type domain-containing protein n=1 Tax=Lithospermum erythrorhizon TaxID=34254 RepID=A0AAV3RP91_LITER
MEKVRQKPESRCGCKAQIKFKRVPNLSCYKIYVWDTHHNHDIHPPEQVHFLNHEVNPFQAALVERHAEVGIPIRQSYQLFSRVVGGDENVGFRPIDLKNHLSSKRQLRLQHGEGTSLLEFFRDESIKKPNYYYSVQVDSDEEISSIFWADGIMRSDYAAFGDVLCFDTTFRTNHLYRPLGCFVGFNHHRQMCVFGCALLFDETADTFSWMFNTFFECMSGKHPISLMTDQCASIRSAVRNVVPSSVFHGLCSWHISENAKKKLGSYANSKFMEELHFLIEDVDSPAEFEFNWDKMVKKCFHGKDVDQITWLTFIKGYKEQWSSAWVKEYFTAGLKSTQLSECFNSLVRKYVKYGSTLTQFFEGFNSMIRRLRAIEVESNFSAIQFLPKNHFPHSSIMQHAAKVYTPLIFAKIHLEFEVISSYFFQPVLSEDEGSLKTFSVFELLNPEDHTSRVDERIVTVDLREIKLSCTCRMFTNWGFFCRHIFKIMEMFASSGNNPRLRTIPDEFILKRWTRLAKGGFDLYADLPPITAHVPTYEESYQQLCLYVNQIAIRVCMFEEPYQVFVKDLIEARKRAETSIQSLGPVKSKRPLDSLAIGVKAASNKKRGRKRFKALTEKRRYKKRASRKKKLYITNAQLSNVASELEFSSSASSGTKHCFLYWLNYCTHFT